MPVLSNVEGGNRTLSLPRNAAVLNWIQGCPVASVVPTGGAPRRIRVTLVPLVTFGGASRLEWHG